jgi:predicted secreted Zn-dependent protease
LAVFPVPSNDFRVQIASEELSRIQQDVERRVQEASASAMKDVWQRLYDKVKHIEERLANPAAVFRDTMLENARELCGLLPRLNFADDPQLEAMRQEVEQKLVSYHPDALRNDPDLRRDTAAKAKEIMDRMAVFMGQ